MTGTQQRTAKAITALLVSGIIAGGAWYVWGATAGVGDDDPATLTVSTTDSNSPVVLGGQGRSNVEAPVPDAQVGPEHQTKSEAGDASKTTASGSIAGIVIDASTRKPIEVFGIRARSRPGKAEAETAAKGPAPSRHAGGRFALAGLRPGEYHLDIGSARHVAIVAGPYDVADGKPVTGLVVPLQRKSAIRGHVLDRSRGAPIGKAVVEVYVAPLEKSAQGAAVSEAGERVDRGETDARGRFELVPPQVGTFRLRIRAKSYKSEERDVTLHASQDLAGLVFQLSPVSRIYGTVLNRRAKEVYRVLLESLAGEQANVAVDPATGSFEATGLVAGDWFVRLHRVGRPGEKLRRTIEALTQAADTRPDVRLLAGASVVVNLDASAEQLGSVVGRCLQNSAPVRGFTVRLVPRKRAGRVSASAVTSSGAKEDRAKARMLESLLRVQSDADGNFEFALVPPGTYTLQVLRRTGRGSRRSPNQTRAAWHSQQVRVSHGVRKRVVVNIETGTASFALHDSKTKKPIWGGLIRAVLAAEAAGQQPRDWRRLSSFVQVVARRGKAVFRNVPVGEYLYFVSGPGIKVLQGRTFVAGGTVNEVQLAVERSQEANSGSASKRTSRRKR